MSCFFQNLKYLLPLVAVAFASTSVEAGFVSVRSDMGQFLTESAAQVTQSETSSTDQDREDRNLDERPAYLKHLDWNQLQFGHTPSGGGMSSPSSVSSGGSASSVGMLNKTVIPCTGLISPLYLREIPFTPQMLIAEIFRPPCA